MGVYEPSTAVRIYLNGSLAAENTNSIPSSICNNSENVNIARRPDGSDSGAFGGIIDEVRISNTARSSDWIATEYNNQSSPSTFYTVGSEELGLAPGGVFLAAVQQILSTIKQNTQQVLGVMTEVLTNSLGLERSQ